MSIRPQYCKVPPEKRFLTSKTRIKTENPIFIDILKKVLVEDNDPFVPEVRFNKGIPSCIRDKVCSEFGIDFSESDEAFVIDAEDGINIYSESERGLLYGCITLAQLTEKGAVDCVLAYDYPLVPVRGIKIYLPAPDDIDFFKQLIEMACYYKYNTVMIEVGGAMEYKRHPEINEGWVEYSRFMNEYSDKTKVIQTQTFDWKKNSIHTENGGGLYLSQETVRELVAYCKERMMNVIPEMPSLSHCDYLLTRHPELAERQDDPYPDTYCPSNPDTYKLLFDVLEEVIEVFEPTEMNIGHDEFYSIGVCEKCREKSAPEIFVDDVLKIKEFLDKHGVKTIIWGEKLLNAYHRGYGPCGGAEYYYKSPKTGEPTHKIPATYTAIEFFPKDVKILNWYWSIDKDYDEVYLKHDLEFIYGNFRGPEFPDWNKRIVRSRLGAIMSNWSALKEDNLQRNGFLYNLVYSYRMFWDKEFENRTYEQLRDEAFRELFRYKYGKALDEAAGKAAAGKADLIEITHTTDKRIEYRSFVDGTFIDMDIYKIGEYVISYEDGTKASIDIVYGGNITNQDVCWDRKLSDTMDKYDLDYLLIEVTYNTLPVKIKGKTYCKFIAKNPYPDKTITGIEIKPSKTGYSIYLDSIRFI